MSAVRFRIVCAWCTKVSEEGTPGAPVSHGICDACLDVELAKLDHMSERGAL